MSQENRRMSIWSRGVISLLVAIWMAVALGHWLANRDEVQEKLGEGEQEGIAQEANIPAAKTKPWRGDISAYQKELDEENSVTLRSDKPEAKLVVATPVAQFTDSTDKQPSGDKADAAALNNDDAVYYLVFASYHHEAQASEMLTRLTAKKVDGKIESSVETDGSKLFRVIGAKEFKDRENAEAYKREMLKIGFDAYVANR